MTWIALEAEIECEMRRYTEHELDHELRALMYRAIRLDRLRASDGLKDRARKMDRSRDKAASDAREAELLASGDIKALRAFQARRRANKRRK